MFRSLPGQISATVHMRSPSCTLHYVMDLVKDLGYTLWNGRVDLPELIATMVLREDENLWIASRLFISIVYYIDRLSYVESSLHLWDKANLIMVDNVFDVFLDSTCQYFIEYFCIDVREGIGLLEFSFYAFL
ncbi:hypothetical protein STEG23_012813 [Scotinomys teguina]